MWCSNGFPEIGDKHGFQVSDTIQQVMIDHLLRVYKN